MVSGSLKLSLRTREESFFAILCVFYGRPLIRVAKPSSLRLGDEIFQNKSVQFLRFFFENDKTDLAPKFFLEFKRKLGIHLFSGTLTRKQRRDLFGLESSCKSCDTLPPFLR